MKKIVLIPTVLLVIIGIVLSSFFITLQKNGSVKKEKIKTVRIHTPRPSLDLGREITEKITIGAIGDILIHNPVYEDAFNEGKYNFDPIFKNVNSLLEKPDILTANQESTLGGTQLGLSSYPCFNSPHEVADALVHTGVDIVSTANNHTLDKGIKGIQSEIRYLDSIKLPHVGSFIDDQDRMKLRILEKNGIKIAFLAYTYGTNGIPVPGGKDYLVNIINHDKMKEEINRARKSADVVVMSVHWGIEYQRVPTVEQKVLAGFLANEGVDVIFGSHPHVLEPMEWIKTKNGRKALVVYSLGNFISGQEKDYKDIGGMATIDITKHVTEKGNTIELSNPLFYPTYVSSKDFKSYRVVPLEKAGSFGLPDALVKYKEIQNHMYQWLR